MNAVPSGTSELPPLAPRDLGATGLRVGAICVGCAPLGDMPEAFTYSVGEERACETVRAILDSPITFLDTAASYGNGESERRIGLVLRERGGLPDGVVLATKADRDLQTGDFSGDQIRRSVERSLRLLGVDRLQLVYLHDPEFSSFRSHHGPGGPGRCAPSLPRRRSDRAPWGRGWPNRSYDALRGRPESSRSRFHTIASLS